MTESSSGANWSNPGHCQCSDASSSSPSPLCESCVRRGLARAHAIRRRALEDRDRAVSEFRQQQQQSRNINSSNNTNGNNIRRRRIALPQFQDESERLRDRLRELRSRAAEEALMVARTAVRIEERRQRQYQEGQQQRTEPGNNASSRVSLDRDRLRKIDSAVTTAMAEAIESARGQVRLLRFGWALQAFELHRLDVGDRTAGGGGDICGGDDDSNKNDSNRARLLEGRTKHARGIGKIGGLPLPNAGPELFAVLPPLELQSALRLASVTTSLVARCLGIRLPHPILLRYSSSSSGGEDITAGIDLPPATATEDSTNQNAERVTTTTTKTTENLSGSISSSFASLIMGQSQALLATMRGGSGGTAAMAPATAPSLTTNTQAIENSPTTATTKGRISMDSAAVEQRVQHSRATVLAEAEIVFVAVDNKNKNKTDGETSSTTTSSSSLYALSVDVLTQDEFAIALQLLQNDIVALCIRAGVPVDELWPAEALLLNLHALYRHCQRQVHSTATTKQEV